MRLSRSIQHIQIRLDEDDIVTDFYDIAPGNDETSGLKKALNSAAVRDDKRTDFPGAFVKFDIGNIPQLPSLDDIHHGLLFETAKTHDNPPLFGSVYAENCDLRTEFID